MSVGSVGFSIGGAIEAYGGGGIDYAALKRAYTADDSIIFTFTDVEDYYPVGLWAYLSDPNIVDVMAGWGLFEHHQSASPLFLAALIGPTLPPIIPSFEAKFIRCLSDQDCWIRFGAATHVQHFIPKGVWCQFYRRTNIIFVVRDTVNGSLNLSFYG